MNPITSVKSRYALATISNNLYSTLTLSGITTLIGQKGVGDTQGYIFVPYIMQQTTPITLDREWSRRILRANRKEKLKKLGWF